MRDLRAPGELASLQGRIDASGFAFVPGAEMRPRLGPGEALEDWSRFAASWDDLPLDTHLPDGHRYRRRRHATLSAHSDKPVLRPEKHQPHFQSVDYNKLVGGIERWFEPIRPDIVSGPSFRAIVGFGLRLFGPLRPGARWHIECHQFRIEARPEAAGLPTPEGVHRDGVDYVLVTLINRTNIESGTTTVHARDGSALGRFTLSSPFDTALVDDHHVMHGVTAVHPVDPLRTAHRDVLVATFRVSPETGLTTAL